MYRRSDPELLVRLREEFFAAHPELDPLVTSVEFRPDGVGGFRVAGWMAMAERPRFGYGEGVESGPIKLSARGSGKTAEMLALVDVWRRRGYLIEERVGAWLAWHPDSEMGRCLAARDSAGGGPG